MSDKKTTQDLLTPKQLAAQMNKRTHLLTDPEKKDMYNKMCQVYNVPVDIAPLDFVQIKDKATKKVFAEFLYANSTCTKYIMARDGLSSRVVRRDIDANDAVFIVEVSKGDRSVEGVGAKSLKGAAYDTRTNSIMHAHTKAERRAVLTYSGMGILDESEISSIPNAAPAPAGERVADSVEAAEAKPVPMPARTIEPEPVRESSHRFTSSDVPALKKAAKILRDGAKPGPGKRDDLFKEEERGESYSDYYARAREVENLIRNIKNAIESGIAPGATQSQVDNHLKDVYETYADDIAGLNDEQKAIVRKAWVEMKQEHAR